MKITCKLVRLACAAAILLLGVNPALSGTPPVSLSSTTAEWSVVVVASSPDTVWVDVSLPGAGAADDCIAESCNVWEMIDFYVTPCPLNRSPSLCDTQFHSHPDQSVHLGLQPGVTYTISGVFTRLGFRLGNSWECDDFYCTYTETPPDKQYTAAPVATATTTWSRIKALYRTP